MLNNRVQVTSKKQWRRLLLLTLLLNEGTELTRMDAAAAGIKLAAVYIYIELFSDIWINSA
ncbi:MAG: hypothetical protein ACOZCL_00110 [Bacillota bacterium]